MRPTESMIDMTRKFVGHDSQCDGLPILLIDCRGKKTVAILADQLHSTRIFRLRIRRECAIGIDIAGPIDGAHTSHHIERSSSEEPFSIRHLSDIRHLPETSGGSGISGGKECGAVVAPTSILIAMESSHPLIILRTSHNDISLITISEEIGIAEIIRKTCRTTIDERISTILLPIYQGIIRWIRLRDSGFRIIHSRIYCRGLTSSELIIAKHTSAPTPLEIIGCLRSESYLLLAPIVEVLA